MLIRYALLLSWWCLWLHPAWSQQVASGPGPTNRQRADQQFEKLAYAPAAALYEQVLADTLALPLADQRYLLARLGSCYRALHNDQQAERTYRNLISTGPLPADYADTYLHLAQLLVGRGAYGDAQPIYELYTTRQAATPTARLSPLSQDVGNLINQAGNYRIDRLALNTPQAEFSPVYYRDGLVFVATPKGATGLRRLFTWDRTPYLDLVYLPDRSMLIRNRPGQATHGSRADQYSVERPLGRDDRTPRTANDSPTIGIYDGSQLATGEAYSQSSIAESERFARSLNSKYHEGPATFTSDGMQVIFTRSSYSKSQPTTGKGGVSKLKLYTARQVNGNWQQIDEMPMNSDEYSTGHPALSRDNQRLYFASDMPGGFGGTDLYMATWTGNYWSEPVNLGPAVNTKGNELFPFADERGNLYLASDGHPGLGGLDLFYAELAPDGRTATSSHNLGEPFNSPQDDFGLITDGTRQSGYFSSNRKTSKDNDDIYQFTREGSLYPCRQLTVQVIDEATKQGLPNTAVVLTGGEPGNERKELQTDGNGLLRLCIDADSELMLLVSRSGYVDTRVGFTARNLHDDQPSRLEIAVNRVRSGQKP